MQIDDAMISRARSAGVLALRLTVAALLALGLAQYFAVRLPLWVVLTALVVTQSSIGRSLKATFDYMAGTLGGAAWAAVVTIVLPQSSEAWLLITLAVALAPLAVAAAIDPRFAAAPVTAAIVVLIPQFTHVTPLASSLERILEVSLGAAAGLFVSFALLPASAFGHTREQAAESLERMATTLLQLTASLAQGLDPIESHRIQDGLGARLAELSIAAQEAERERRLRWGADPLTGPLLRTLLRLRHDLVMLGRAASAPLPEPLRAKLEPRLDAVAQSVSAHLRACATAIRTRSTAPPCSEVDRALGAYTREIESLREAGAFRHLRGEDVERVFALGFAFEQMHRNLNDLIRSTGEWSAQRA